MGPLNLPRKISVLGCTGSVGVSTLDLLQRAGVEVEVVALAAGRNVELLVEQALQWRPRIAVIQDEQALPRLRAALAGSGIATAAGAAAVVEAAAMDAQWVMSAIVGFAGLAPTLAAARPAPSSRSPTRKAWSAPGPSFCARPGWRAERSSRSIPSTRPIFQVLEVENRQQVSRLILTSSGGPFRSATYDEMARATPEQAVAHPNFSMGAKISVDSATMMNKGLEVIEAAYLFAVPPERIEVLIHPQQIIHSLVEYADGSTLAQLGPPDMRPPIACAFAWPDRLPWPAPKLDLVKSGPLTFADPRSSALPGALDRQAGAQRRRARAGRHERRERRGRGRLP